MKNTIENQININKTLLTFVGIQAIFAFCLICLVTVGTPKLMTHYFTVFSYYLTLLIFLFYFHTLLTWIQNSYIRITNFIKENLKGIVVSAILCLVVVCSVEAKLRILSDEANFIGVSRSLAFEKKADFPLEASYHFMNFNPSDKIRVLDKRPPMVSFLVGIAHSLLGYQAANAFLVNALFLFLLMVLLYAYVYKKFKDSALGISALFLLVSNPILSITARSAGIDFLNCFFIFTCFLSVSYFLESPQEIRFRLLWVNLIALAMTRYESILFFVVIIFMLLIIRKIKLRFFGESLIYSLTPLLMLPIVWQRILKANDSELPQSSLLKAFSLDYYAKHNIAFFNSLFDFRFYLPFNNILHILGLLALVYFVYKFMTKNSSMSQANKDTVVVFGFSMMILWVVLTSYFFGKIADPASARLFAPISFFLSLLLILLLADIKKYIHLRPAAFVIIGFLLFVLYHPIAMIDRFSNAMTLTREQYQVSKFLLSKNDKNIFVIAERPFFYTNYQMGATSFEGAKRDPRGVLNRLKNRLWQKIYVVQTVDIASQKPTKSTMLPKEFKLNTVYEFRSHAREYIRISEVVL